MKVGDLVKHNGMNDVAWCGIITKKELFPQDHLTLKFCVVWTSGVEGWFYSHELEVICK
tara:strand:+ start:90 stop:266 length:177 start_codon:yes stop_codon:yes gene_type:complete